MRRRDLLSGAASSFVWLVPARAHQSNKLKVIGNLATEPSASTAFFDRLRELGWVEGRTVVIERRYSEGRPERVAEAALTLPIFLLIGAALFANMLLFAVGTIWVVHIGGDRAIGTGLKYATGFWDTHLSHSGRS
jgi:hypothetical protein